MSTSTGRQAGGRAARRAARTKTKIEQLPGLKRGIPTVEVLSTEGIEKIINAAYAILEEVGCDFRDPIAPESWKKAGADVRGENVRIPRELVRKLMSTAPSGWTLTARNRDLSVKVGGDNTIFVPMAGAPFVEDLDGVRRYSKIEDLNNFHKLAHMSPALHSTSHVICEPMDIAIPHRHLHITYSSMKHSDKTFMGMSTTGENAEDVIEMVKILFGEDFIKDHPVVTANCNCNSPLVWDESMLGAMRAYGRWNQPVLCSPFVLGGANTPASTVPSVAQLVAEGMAGMAYAQLENPGTPVIFGHYLSTVSMQSGAPMAGTPEISLMNFMVGQVARYLNVPWRTSCTLGGAKSFDAQAGYESATTMMATILAGANYVWHSAGWNEGGLVASMSKFVVDAEQIAMGYRMAEGPKWDDFEEALATIRNVGPAGHFLGEQHTQDNFQRAFFMPKLFDNNSFEQWEAAGSIETPERATIAARQLLNDYEAPALDPAIDEALLAFIKRRENEINPDKTL
ncbi:trimethylamine methyltransferase family protein [Kiloniella sp. b19]|uniref:trimethylamine methyltransferase family protein n=1 Tax=Kiloniella sp. GXU_MW_B19 TaxID=3141326 RepID=UPI0031DDEB6D